MKKVTKRFLVLAPILVGLILFWGGIASSPAIAQDPTDVLNPTETALTENSTPGADANPPPAETVPVGSPEPQATITGTAEVQSGEPGQSVLEQIVPALENVLPARTPLLTATPDAVAESVEKIVQETGLSDRMLLSLRYADWINLVISLLYILIGYVIGTWLVRWLFPRLVQRTATPLDDELLQTSGSELRWLAVVLILRFATNRLVFIDADIKTWLTDIYFFLALFLVSLILWRLTGLAAQQARDRAEKRAHRKEAESLIALSVWAARLLVIVLALSLTLAHYGTDITGLALFLSIIGLAFSLSGRDILSDMMSGAIILIDRPYRIGDRIALPAIDSWGDVIDIGLRSTRIVTVDNRMVIVPNSQIGKDQIVNYSYPDPSYYDEIKIVIAYDNDVDPVGRLLVDTVRLVEGVQQDRAVEALLIEFTETHMVFRVSWWLASYEEFLAVRDRVSRATIQALKQAGVVLPYGTSNVRVEVLSRLPAGLDSQRLKPDGTVPGTAPLE